MAGDPDCADGFGENGRRHPRLGSAPDARARDDAETPRLVPADAHAGRSDRPGGQRVVRQAEAGRSRRTQRPPPAQGRPRAHGRYRVGALARSSRAARGHRRHAGHAAEPCPHARLRLFARHLADGVRASPRGHAVGVRRSAAHGRGTRNFSPARSVSAMRGRSRRAERRAAESSGPQPVDLRDTGSGVAPNRGLLAADPESRRERAANDGGRPPLGSGPAAGRRSALAARDREEDLEPGKCSADHRQD